MSRVFGDSTPFLHDLDYLELLDDGIDCAVKLVAAADTIQAANRTCDQLRELEQVRLKELNALQTRVESAAQAEVESASDTANETSQQLIATGRQIVGQACAALAADLENQKSAARTEAQTARNSTYHAVQEFVAKHTSPGSTRGLRVSVTHERGVAQISIGTPFRLQAVFSVDLSDPHPWSKPRRVGDLVSSLEVPLPQESGWLSKRVEITPVKLDRFFIEDIQLSGRSEICLQCNDASTSLPWTALSRPARNRKPLGTPNPPC